MEEQDYLKKGKQMENLYKDRIDKITSKTDHQVDIVDILCSQKVKSDYPQNKELYGLIKKYWDNYFR